MLFFIKIWKNNLVYAFITKVPLSQYLREVPSSDRNLHTFQSLLSFPLQVVPKVTRSRNMQLLLRLNDARFNKQLMTLKQGQIVIFMQIYLQRSNLAENLSVQRCRAKWTAGLKTNTKCSFLIFIMDQDTSLKLVICVWRRAAQSSIQSHWKRVKPNILRS